MTLISLAIIYGYLLERRLWVRILLVVLMVPSAIVSNAIRIMGAGMMAHHFGPAAAEGFLHEFSGWVIFLACTPPALCFPLDSAAHWKSAETRQPMLKSRGSVRWWVTAGILLGAFVLLQTMSHGEAIVPRQPLHDLPYTLGPWTGEEQPMQERVVQAVGVS